MSRAYHLKAIQLLLNLLSQHGSQSIARRNLASSIIFQAGPSIVELDLWAESDVSSSHASWRAR